MIHQLLPHSVAAHRETGDVQPITVAVELLHRFLERRERRLRDAAAKDAVVRALRHHYDRIEPVAVPADLRWHSHLRLFEPIAPALARTVHEQDHRQLAMTVVAERYVHLILHLQRANGDST